MYNLPALALAQVGGPGGGVGLVVCSAGCAVQADAAGTGRCWIHHGRLVELLVLLSLLFHLPQVLPRLAQLLQGWSPLGQPGLPLGEFASWRPLLEGESARQGGVLAAASMAEVHGSASDAYMRLVVELVLPPLRRELTNDWNPRCACVWEGIRGWRRGA